MSRYVDSHANPRGAGDARPTALQIVEDEGLVGKLADKVIIVTGASSGLGIETLRAVHATGATVYGTVRSLEKGKAVVEEILAKDSKSEGKIDLLEMDLESFDSIRKGVQEFLSKESKIHVLINNAGVMATPQGRTKDGWETQFGTNHLGHFLLFELLKPTLLASASPSFPSRVVSVSSIGHRTAKPNLADINQEMVEYNPWVAYGYAKTANIWFANEVERRYGGQNLHATSLHPGGIWTPLQKHLSSEQMEGWKASGEVAKMMKSPEQGAATTVYAALSEEWKDKGGRYLADCIEQSPAKGESALATDDSGYATWAYDPESERELWAFSLKAVGIRDYE